MGLRLKGRTMEEVYANECHYYQKENKFLEKDNQKLRELCIKLANENKDLKRRLDMIRGSLDKISK